MIFCFEGISGSGKTTLMSALEQHFRKLGFKVFKYHFYSDIKQYSPRFSTKASKLESTINNGELSVYEQIKALEFLCSMACTAFLQRHWDETDAVYIFDRSPITYLAYAAGGYNLAVKLWPEFYETTQKMHPLILSVDIKQAEVRNIKRAEVRSNNIIHGCSFEISERVQEYYLDFKNAPFYLDVLPRGNEFNSVIGML